MQGGLVNYLSGEAPSTVLSVLTACQLLHTQIAVIEFARNVLGLKDANSTEFAPGTQHPAVVFMPEISTTHKGGTMRLGARRTVLQTVQCISAKLYQKETFIDERHRHRWGMQRHGYGVGRDVGQERTGWCEGALGLVVKGYGS